MHITTNTTKTYTLTLSLEETIWLRNHMQSKPFGSEMSETKTTRELLVRMLNEAINPSGAYPRGHNTLSAEIVREAPR